VSLTRPPALLDAGQFFSAHDLRGGIFFESGFSKKLNRQQLSKSFQRLFFFPWR
jgi:hypothetical protein